MVSDFLPPVGGGLEGHVDDLAAALAARGHDVHAVSLTPRPRPRSSLVQTHTVGALASRVLPHVDADRPFPPPVPDPVARRSLRLLLEELRPDVVHAHSWLGASVPRRPGVPLVLTAHDYALVCALRTLRPVGSAEPCAGPSLRRCGPCAAGGLGRVPGHLMAVGTTAGRRLLRPDAVLTLSAEVARRLGPHLSRPAHVVGGLLPAAVAEAQDLPALPSGSFVLYGGDPGEHKGTDVLLELWSQAHAPPAPLVLALTRPLDRPAPPGVHVVRLTRDQMPAAWRRAAVAVVPSRWAEPFGMSAMEALAAGTPVVASRVGALPEVVRDGVDGLLVPPGDGSALGAALRALLEDPGLRARTGAAAAAGADRFRADAVVARVEAVYAAVLGRVREGAA